MPQVTFNLEANEAQAVQGFLRLVEAQKQTERQFKKTVNAHQTGAKEILTDLGKVATAFLTIQTAIQAAQKAFELFNQQKAKGAERTSEGESGLSKLAQLANGDKTKYERMLDAAKRTSTDAGIGIDQAAKLQFGVESYGVDRTLFARLVGNQVIDDPETAASSAYTSQQAFGKNKAGSIRDILNRGLVASAKSKIDLDEINRNISLVAPTANMAGVGIDETYAQLAILSDARKSAEVAATEMNSLNRSLMEHGLTGDIAGLKKAKDLLKNLSPKQQMKWFGREEAMQGFQTLSQHIPDLEQFSQEIAASMQGGENDAVGRMLNVRESIPDLQAAKRKRIAEQNLANAQGNRYGAGQLNIDAAILEQEQAHLHENIVKKAIRSTINSTLSYFNASEQTINQANDFLDSHQSTSRDSLRRAGGFSEKVLELTKALDENTKAIKKIHDIDRYNRPNMNRNNAVIE